MIGFIYSEQNVLFGKKEIIGFGGDGFEVKVIPKSVSNDMIIKNHYSKKVAGFATTYIYLGVFVENNLIGTLQYGFLMNPKSCVHIHAQSTVDTSIELNRAWYADGLDKNIKSKALSYSFKYLRGVKPNLIFIQSFADERCGKLGITYQSANFNYYGLHNSIFWEYDGKYYHNIAMTIKDKTNSSYTKDCAILQANKDKCTKHTFRQFRYIYWLKQKYKKQCLLKEMPYPKHYKENSIND